MQVAQDLFLPVKIRLTANGCYFVNSNFFEKNKKTPPKYIYIYIYLYLYIYNIGLLSNVIRSDISILHGHPMGSPRVCASTVKACCTNSWSAAELSPSSGGWGRTARSGCRCTPCLHTGAKTHRRHSAAFSAPRASSRNPLQVQRQKQPQDMTSHGAGVWISFYQTSLRSAA